MKRITLNGAVFSGGGAGKKFLRLRWVKRQIKQKLGFVPYLGTLNVLISEESAKRRKLLEKKCAMKICPAEGYCNGLLFKALIGTLECGIVVPEVAGYPKTLLEIIAPVNLREMLQLEDGDEVTVTISL
ncbi:MAG: CTP-dependent riboflavin kinase [Candidatus Bathyarchaeota archaeon]|nr:CTP-dependent riboflavin kinase [Candidatus Bathyarchaeota archaeon]